LLAAGVAAAIDCLPAHAQVAVAPEQRPPELQAAPRFEAWVGAQAFHRLWSLYSGTMFAPFGSVREDGVRLRVVGGYGDYTTGTMAFADLLLGYHKQLGSLTIKFLAGLTAEDRHADDPSSSLDGANWGGKAVLETWWNVTDQVWLSTDLSWGSLHTSYSGRARLGWRLSADLSLGVEGGAAGALERDIARVGGFVRYEWATGEASLSAGMAFDGPRSDWEGTNGPFGTLSLLMRF
jgi:hypothetical protein